MTTNVPRKHHYVPQLLLRGFTISGTNDGTLHIIDLLRRRTYTSTPDGTGKETDYNLVDAPDVDPFVVEHDILANTVEGPAAAGIETIRRGEVPSEGDRQAILNFIAMQALRAPSRRDAFDAFSTDLARLTTEMMIDDDATFDALKRSDPELADLTRAEAKEIARDLVAKNTTTGHLVAILPAFGPIFDLLERRSWIVLNAPDDAEFVCSDDPVVLQPSGTRSPRAPRGFASIDAQVFMPVGRHHALLGVWPQCGTEPTWAAKAIDGRTVAVMNTGPLILTARRFVASAVPAFCFWLGGEIKGRDAYLELVKNRP